MDVFRIGKLRLAQHEQLVVGDPCYFANTPNGCHTIDLGWAAGNYEVYLATEGGLPLALILSRYGSLHPSAVDWFIREEPVDYLGVDSGQMAMIAASVLPTWTHNDRVAWDAPACDYDYASIATLQSQLRANLIGSRLTFVSAEANMSIGTAVASSTRHGDGEYPLVIVRSSIPSYETDEREIAAVAVFFDWEDEEGFDEEDAQDPLSDEDGEGLVDKVDAEARHHVRLADDIPDWTRIDPDLLLRAVRSTPRR